MFIKPRRLFTIIALGLAFAAPGAHADTYEDDMVTVNAMNTGLAIGLAAGEETAQKAAPAGPASDAKACVPAAKDVQGTSKDDGNNALLLVCLLILVVIWFISFTAVALV